MGVRHLVELREFLKANSRKSFTRTFLRIGLRQNYPTMNDNLDFLVNIEKTVIKIDGEPTKFQWKK